MPAEDKIILRYNPIENLSNKSHIFYLDIESLLVKIQPQQNNNLEESYTERNAIDEACGYSLKSITSYATKKDKHSYYRGTDCIKKLCKYIKEQATEIINIEEKNKPLTDYETRYYEKRKYCHICKGKFCTDDTDKEKLKKYGKVIDHCYYTGKYRRAAHDICNLRYKVQQEIPVVIHNGSKCDYHLIIKELVEEFKNDFSCLGENTEKYITFSIPIKKENIDGKITTYKIRFIDSYRFMDRSLANLVDNLSEINNEDCKRCMKKIYINSECQYINHKKNKLLYKCKKCDDMSYKPVSELIERFLSVYKFCKKDLNKFVLLLQKGVLMNTWIAGQELMNRHYHPKNPFIMN